MTTPLGSAYQNPPGIRLDDEPLDLTWRRPKPPRPAWSGSLTFLAIMAALLLLVGVLLATGALDRREDRRRAYPLGEVVDVGSMRITFTHADLSFEEPTLGSDPPHWEIRAYGTAVNTTGKRLLLKDPGVVGLPEGRVIGGYDVRPLRQTVDGKWENDRYFQFQALETEVPIVLTGKINQAWKPTGHVYVGMKLQTYAAHDSDRGFSNEYWSNNRTGTAAGFWVPTRLVPSEP